MQFSSSNPVEYQSNISLDSKDDEKEKDNKYHSSPEESDVIEKPEYGTQQEKTDDTTMSSIAEWIGSTCLCITIAFVIIINVNPDLLNPFINLFK